VKALVIKVDKELHWISLGLKASYIEGDLCSKSDEDTIKKSYSSSHEDDGSIDSSRDDMAMDQDSFDSEDEQEVGEQPPL